MNIPIHMEACKILDYTLRTTLKKSQKRNVKNSIRLIPKLVVQAVNAESDQRRKRTQQASMVQKAFMVK